MIARIRKSMEEKDQGFTLIELLVVMIIIGILAAIAIPVFLNQKKKAAETSAKTDATNISKEIAAAFVDNPSGTLGLAFTSGNTNSAGSSTSSATLTFTDSNSNVTTDTVKVGAGNNASVTGNSATTYCVTVQPAQAGASAWSAGPNGLKSGGTCP